MTEAVAAADAATGQSQTGPVVSAQDLTRRYGEGETAVDALRGVSLDVPKGQLTAVMGPSGSGKSTLMHILAGLDKPTSGEVTIAGTSISELERHGADEAPARAHRLHLPVLQPAADADRGGERHPPALIAGEKPDKAWVDELMGKIGLKDRRSHRPSELSGGQQQRVAIGRALVSRPTIVFADEPTGNLDSKTSGEILDLMRDSVDSYGQTTVMVTHDPRAAAIADRILFLADGLIVRDLGKSTPRRDLRSMDELALDDARRPQRALGPQAPHVPDRARDRPRRRDDQRHATSSRTRSARVHTIFDKSYENADAVVSGKVAFKNTESDTSATAGVPESVLRRSGAAATWRRRRARSTDEAKLVGRDGKTITTAARKPRVQRRPRGRPALQPAEARRRQVAGRRHEIAIDQGTAGDEGVQRSATRSASPPTTASSSSRSRASRSSRSVSSIGGATIAIFDLPTAQRLFHKDGKLDEIQVAAKPGVTPAKLVDEIRPAPARDRRGEDGARPGAEAGDDVNEGISIFQKFLLAFAGIALFVGAFVIANTLSITIAQRVREFATLRTIGASRRQVLRVGDARGARRSASWRRWSGSSSASCSRRA